MFIEHYLNSKDAILSSVRAGHAFCDIPASGYYVYFLADTKDGKIFYVGKGKGDRVKHHVKDVLKGKVCNVAKNRRIKAILKTGRKPLELVYACYDLEIMALYVESEMIQKLKKHGITNIIGTEILLGSAEDYRAETDIGKARGMLERLKPFEQWQREHNHPDAIAWTVREFGSMRKFYDWFRGGIVGVIKRLERSSHANA